MKKLLLVLPLLLINCTKTEAESKTQKLSDVELDIMAAKAVDSAMAAAKSEALAEDESKAKNQQDAPVQVLKSELVKMEYSNHRNISLKYKNVSDKVITGIRFEWYGKNAFGDPADMGNFLQEGTGGGFTDETLRPGKTGYGTWEIFSNDAKTITAVRAYEVAFEDGTKWTAK